MALGDESGYVDFDNTGRFAFFQPAALNNSSALGSNAISQMDHAMVLGNVGSGTYDSGAYTGQTYVGIGTTKPDSLFSVSPVYYDTGTASQSGTTITGSGTTWTDSMIGMKLIIANGTSATITAFGSTTSLTASVSQTVSSQAYRIHTGGLQVAESTGWTTQYGNLTVQAIPNTYDNLLSVVTSSGLEASYFTYTGELKVNTSVATRDSNTTSTNTNTFYIGSGDAGGATSDSGDVVISAGTATGNRGSVYIGSSAAGAQTTYIDANKTGYALTVNNASTATSAVHPAAVQMAY